MKKPPDHPTTTMKSYFFNEEGEMVPPFSHRQWRGCALYRDAYDNTRMPQFLFEAIISASGADEICICGYFESESCELVQSTWDAYRQFMLERRNWSLEYVVFDRSRAWAILADADATIFGGTPEIAAAVDTLLASRGTGLVQITDAEFPGLDPKTQPGARYFLAVSGR